MGKKLFTVLCLVIGVAVFCVGCGNKQEVKDVTAGVTENTRTDIQKTLEENENIAEVTWSEDKTCVFFTKDIGNYVRQLYQWKAGETNENQVKGVSGNLYDITQSDDGKYITVNEGTGTIYTTIIISVEDLLLVEEIVNVGGPVWSPDSDKLAFAVLNDKKPSIDMEWDGTSDLLIYNIKSKGKEIVLVADNDFNYNPISWDENGLKYEKNYLDGRKSEELTTGILTRLK
ncbi:MAG: hypothetical protein WCR27_03230 [Eubacteriales bacterium]